MWGSNYMAGGAMGIGMILLWLIPIALLLWCIFRASGKQGDRLTSEPPRTAREILDARYAKGEIDREAYLRCRADLERTPEAER